MPSNPQRLYLMQVAILQSYNIPVPCYLVQTADGKNILIDTGMPVEDPPDFTTVRGEDVIQQLAKIGLKPGDIHMLICTHFDVDHAGLQGAFTEAEWVVQRKQYENAPLDERFAATRSQWDYPHSRYRFVEGDTQLFPGFDLIETSAHVPGHQSVLLHLPETGVILLAIDAVAKQHEFTRDRSSETESAKAMQADRIKLLDLVERENVSLVIFGHDLEQWNTLKKLPEYYG